MKLFQTIAFLFLSLICFSQTKYGALTVAPSPVGAVDFKLKVAGGLGVTCLRDGIQLEGANPDVRLFYSPYSIVLNVNTNNLQKGKASPFIKDTFAYKVALQKRILALPKKPVLLVPENEESNRQNYSGYAIDYINQLKAAITVGHDLKIPVTNGGLTYNGLLYSLYSYYLKSNRGSDAKALQEKTRLQVKNPVVIERGAFTDSLIAAYALLKIDVNIHWYQSNTDVSVLQQMLSMLQARGCVSFLSNEAGQYHTSPLTITTLLNSLSGYRFKYVVLYDGTGAGGKAKPFHYKDGSLADNGKAVHDFISK